jgi:hypothetical protein
MFSSEDADGEKVGRKKKVVKRDVGHGNLSTSVKNLRWRPVTKCDDVF